MFDKIASTPSKFQQFRAEGDTGKWGNFRIDAGWFSIAIAQRIKRNGNDEMCESVAVYCSQELESALVIRVVVFNPDWHAPMQIARIVSRPDDPRGPLAPIGFNLEHVVLES